MVTGTNGKTLTTALTVGILKRFMVRFWPIQAVPIDHRDYDNLRLPNTLKTGKNIAKSSKLTRLVYLVSVTISSQAYLSSLIFSWPDGPLWWDLRLIRWFWMLSVRCLRLQFSSMVTVHFSTSQLFQILYNILVWLGERSSKTCFHYNTEGILCPDCQGILKYELNTYANLELIFAKTVDVNVLTWTTVWQTWLS